MSFLGVGITNQSPLRYGTGTTEKRQAAGAGDFAEVLGDRKSVV